MQQILIMIHVFLSIAIISLVLIQHGKGADIGATFGSGASNTVFGSQGSGSFLMKVTSTLAALFFITSLAIGIMTSHQVKNAQQMKAPTPTEMQKNTKK